MKTFKQFILEHKTYPLGTILHWTDFKKHILELPLNDSFGKLSDEEKKHMSGAGENWELKAIDPQTLKVIDDPNVDVTMPVIISNGDILDGTRRIQTAINNNTKSISAWIGSN